MAYSRKEIEDLITRLGKDVENPNLSPDMRAQIQELVVQLRSSLEDWIEVPDIDRDWEVLRGGDNYLHSCSSGGCA